MSYRVTIQVDVNEVTAGDSATLLLDVLSSDIRFSEPVIADIEENDPSPYCGKCGAKVARQCECGPILPDD